MDPNEVLKGIEHFFGNIIPRAKSCEDWSDCEIFNAVLWAQFCEEVYHVFRGSQTEQKLDELIHNLVSCQNIGRNICFEDLNQSYRILYEIFTDNPGVSKDQLTAIETKLNSDESVEKCVKDVSEFNDLCFELTEALKPIKLMNSKRSLYYEAKAEVYLNLLRDLVLDIPSEDEVEKIFSDALRKLSGSKNDLMLLLHVLSLSLPKNEISILKVQEFVIYWTILNVLPNENPMIKQLLWKDLTLLRAISLNSSVFLNFYLDFITKHALALSHEFEDGEMKWVSKSSNANTFSLDDILTHFRSLLKEEDDVSESTKKYLLNLLDNYPNELIYKEIFTCVT